MRGLSVFKEKFADYSGNYVVIGGMACLIIFEDVGESFRATQDVDIVVLMEENNHDFAAAFWEFIKDGGYQQIAQGSLHDNFSTTGTFLFCHLLKSGFLGYARNENKVCDIIKAL